MNPVTLTGIAVLLNGLAVVLIAFMQRKMLQRIRHLEETVFQPPPIDRLNNEFWRTS